MPEILANTKKPRLSIGAAAVLLGTLSFPALAGAIDDLSAAERRQVEMDRASILAMAGDYKVTFDMRETVSFQTDYKPKEPTRVSGDEIVRVIADTGDTISLQHLLVMQGKDGSHVIKHWRHDWVYEPRSLLEYAGAGQWLTRKTDRTERSGKWSETIWQTDDSPRYGVLGSWRHENGVSEFTSERMKRPLPRRDSLKHPPYAWFESVERYVGTPQGWVQEETNAKLGSKDGKTVTFVHENVVNTYDRFSAFAVAAAEDYWRKTADYWASVRSGWNEAERDGEVRVTGITIDGIVANGRLMDLGDEVAAGKTTPAQASDEARRLILAGDRQRGDTAALK